jgi:ATP-binding protein involved in chromosome partitioning
MLGVIDPELGDNVVDLGMYRRAEIAADGAVTVHLALTTAACPLRGQLKRDVTARVGSLPGVTSVRVVTDEMSRDEKAALMARARWKARERPSATSIPGRTRILAVSSGKGGVGKSSVTVNLAVALAARGLRIGLLDADIAGFSVPRMLGLDGTIEARRDTVDRSEGAAGPAGPDGAAGPNGTAGSDGTAGASGAAGSDGGTVRTRMVPVTRRVGAGSVEVLSMGFLSGEDQAIMWRGLMLNRAVQHFVEDGAWGDLDYLLIDMPPGTGDIQMGLARMIPRAEMLIVTTPALAAQKVAVRAADMARKGYLRVAGVIENMSGFVCAHGERYDLFGAGGGERLAAEIGAPLLARIPIEPGVSAGGDTGAPAALGSGPEAAVWAALADAVVAVAPVVEMRDCTARLFEAVDAALDRAGAPSA